MVAERLRRICRVAASPVNAPVLTLPSVPTAAADWPSMAFTTSVVGASSSPCTRFWVAFLSEVDDEVRGAGPRLQRDRHAVEQSENVLVPRVKLPSPEG